MANPRPQVGIALLNWNGYDDTARCLSSLRESRFRPALILVFDNGSADGSAERLKTEFPEIELVLGGENHGFSGGNNRAAKQLLDAGMDYVWVLNNDTQVEPGCLGSLVRILEEDPGIGAASAKIWFMDEPRIFGYAGSAFNRWTFHSDFRGLRDADVGQYDAAEDVEILSGCCMLIRAETLREIGLFNRAFFAYAEDIDWSLRAREAGIRLRYEPQAALWHKMLALCGKTAIPRPRNRRRAWSFCWRGIGSFWCACTRNRGAFGADSRWAITSSSGACRAPWDCC